LALIAVPAPIAAVPVAIRAGWRAVGAGRIPVARPTITIATAPVARSSILPTPAIIVATFGPAAFPIAALPIVPALASATAVVDIIAVTRIIIIVVPAAIKAGLIARWPIIAVAIIAAIAIIAAANAHAAITITVVIGATAQRQCACKSDRRQEPMSDARHRLSPHLYLMPCVTRLG
jgi:hypothetical protein